MSGGTCVVVQQNQLHSILLLMLIPERNLIAGPVFVNIYHLVLPDK